MPHRQQPPTLQQELHLSNIYVLPTRSGFVLFATLMLLLVSSINFQINLGYALTFLIAGATIASIFTAYRTLRHLRLSTRGVSSAFAGNPLQFAIVIHNPDRYTHYGIGLAKDEYVWKYEKNEWTWLDIAPGETASATLSMPATQRGWIALPQLMVLTRFPMGVFRAWSVWQPAVSALVYPESEPDPPALPTDPLHSQSASNTTRRWRGDEYDGNRLYQPGDPIKQIVWKKVTPGGELISRQMAAFESRELWLTLPSTRLAMTEAQLCRLTAWVIKASHSGIAYGLQLGTLTIAPATGEAHQLKCLRALALYQLPQSPEQGWIEAHSL